MTETESSHSFENEGDLMKNSQISQVSAVQPPIDKLNELDNSPKTPKATPSSVPITPKQCKHKEEVVLEEVGTMSQDDMHAHKYSGAGIYNSAADTKRKLVLGKRFQ